MKKVVALVASILLVGLSLCACSGNSAGSDSAAGSDKTDYSVDGVTYSLSSEWNYDEETKTFTKSGDSTSYEIVTDQDRVGQCTSSEERSAEYSPSDGIDTSKITVGGQDALLAVEPVNEIKSINLFFYKDGKEHLIYYEVPYEDGSDSDVSDTTQELIDSIS